MTNELITAVENSNTQSKKSNGATVVGKLSEKRMEQIAFDEALRRNSGLGQAQGTQIANAMNEAKKSKTGRGKCH